MMHLRTVLYIRRCWRKKANYTVYQTWSRGGTDRISSGTLDLDAN